MTITVTPAQFAALKRAELEAARWSLSGGFDGGRWIAAVRDILGDAVIRAGGGEIVIDWTVRDEEDSEE